MPTFLYNNLINKLIQNPDKVIVRWWIFFPVIVLMTISFITLKHTNIDLLLFSSTFIKQLIWFGIGCVVFLLSQWLRIQFFQEYAYHLYAILLIAQPIFVYFSQKFGQSWQYLPLDHYAALWPTKKGGKGGYLFIYMPICS